MADAALADRLGDLIEGLEIDSADGRAGVTAILRELETASPGAVARLSAGLRMRRLGLRTDIAH